MLNRLKANYVEMLRPEEIRRISKKLHLGPGGGFRLAAVPGLSRTTKEGNRSPTGPSARDPRGTLARVSLL